MLTLTQLESRENPAPLIPGWDGAEQHVYGHFSGTPQLDLAAIALDGGSCRVMVFQGARDVTEIDDYSRVLLNEIVFDPNFRGGGRGLAVEGTTGATGSVPDTLLVVPGVGGGPHVAQFDFDSASGAMRLAASFFAPYPESFRGGLRVGYGDIDRDGTPEAIFLPGEGGGPHLTVVDLRTHETELSIWVGDPNDVSGAARFEPTGATIGIGAHHYFWIQYGETVDNFAESKLFAY